MSEFRYILSFCAYSRGLQRTWSHVQIVRRLHDQDVQTGGRERPLQGRHPVLPPTWTARCPQHGVLGTTAAAGEKDVGLR